MLAAAIVLCVAAEETAAARRKDLSAVELTNVLLEPEYSRWLVGPVAWMATDDEVESYLALDDSAAAADFIDQFWKRRDPYPDQEGNKVRQLFDERAAEADKLFSEAGQAGHRTDRGTVYVVYGPPEETRFDLSPRPTDPPIETWVYPKDAEEGLDGGRPERTYRFFKLGDLTVFYRVRPGERLMELDRR